MDKSSIYPIGEVRNANALVEELGYKLGSFPTSYLGLPLGANYNSVSVCEGIEEILRRKLAC